MLCFELRVGVLCVYVDFSEFAWVGIDYVGVVCGMFTPTCVLFVDLLHYCFVVWVSFGFGGMVTCGLLFLMIKFVY